MAKFIVLDTETAPTATCQGVNPSQMRVYDCGYIVADDDGFIYEKRSYVVRETFRDIDMMNSAYYANKLPLYYQGLLTGEWVETSYYEIWKQLAADCKKYNVKKVWAYNARFDRDTLNSTLEDYSNGFRNVFLPFGVKFYDIMQYAKTCITNKKKYAKFCTLTGSLNGLGKPSNSAETVYRYLSKNGAFSEAHTALQDCEIELAILLKCKKTHTKQPKALGCMAWRGEK